MSAAADQVQSYLMPQSVISRGLAYVIDTAVVAVLSSILMMAGVLPGGDMQSFSIEAVNEMYRSNPDLVLAINLILAAYFLVCEGVWGRTLGKRVLGLRVVRALDGEPCGWSRAFVRNLIRPLDLLFLVLPGAAVVLITPGRQRIGDLLGGTLVVREVKVPAAMAAVIPRLLRRCDACGRLAPATGPCPGCAAPAPAPRAAQPFGAQMLQPLAGMMAAGEAAAALRVAAQGVLVAESAYGAASAAESARLARAAEQATTEMAAPGAAPDHMASADEVTAPRGDVPAESPTVVTLEGPSVLAPEPDPFIHTDDAPDMSGEYIAAWRGLMAAVEALRERRADLDAAVLAASVSLGQVTAADTVLGGLLDQVAPYLDADDDEAVLAAFMARTSRTGPTAGGAADGAAS